MHPTAEKIKSKFPRFFVETKEWRGDLSVTVHREGVSEVCRFVHDEPEMNFDYIVHISSVDYPEREERFEVVYEFYSLKRRARIRIKARLPAENPSVRTVTDIWKGADFMEREVFDMMGIRFDGHPNLRRILLPDDYDEGYPLRKDFPVEGKGWRDTFEFITEGSQTKKNMTTEARNEEKETQVEHTLTGGAPEPNTSTVKLPMLRTEKLLLNMGPQHPSTHGVLKIILDLEGERIKQATPVLGYLHRGVEKLAEGGTYHQFIPHTDRLDYVSAMYNNFAYVRAVEKLMDMTVPDRAEYLRTIVAEIQRIIGHLFWLGTQALDIGAMTVFFYTFREREVLLDFFDELCGARLTTSWYRIGGVEGDMTPKMITDIRNFLATFDEKLDEYNILLEKNRIWIARTRNIAVISAEDAISFGLSGPSLRGSGVDYDLRKYEPYGAYDKVEWDVPVGQNGDTYDRYWIRVLEMKESAKIVSQCLDQLPDGPFMVDDPRVTLPSKDKVFTNLEQMIRQFKLFTSGFDTPAGEIYCGTEAHKGELGFYIVSDGSGKPYRLKIRPPSFIHMGAFDHMARGYMIADVITIFGTYDIVMGECDR